MMWSQICQSVYTKNSIMECAICFESVTGSCQQRRLGCNHLYHKGCIDNWIVRTPTCPLCRSPVVVREDTPQPPMSVVIARVMSLIRDYAQASDDNERLYKLDLIYKLVERHHLSYDDRVCVALARHGIPLHVTA